MPTMAVIGAQWGDEGKGKIVDFLAAEADVVVRFQGGNNAGHSVKVGEELYKMHHLPSGIIRAGKLAVIGNGVVIDPGVLLDEINNLTRRGKSVKNLRISERAHVIMPYHRLLDGAEERLRKSARVGTTGRGIGPAYSDKVSRLGIRMGDLADESALKERLELLIPIKNKMLRAFGTKEVVDAKTATAELIEQGRLLKPYITDTGAILDTALSKDKKILFEGAQGTMLDIDHGTYPFVTSSTTTSGNVASGSGIRPTALGEVFGVTKAYTTRVGAGPFPSEIHDELHDRIVEMGNEYGTTTGRSRRCGWLDLVALRYANSLNDFSSLAMTKIDVLGGLDEVKVCTHYRLDGKKLTRIPSDLKAMERCRPAYESFEGWDELGPARLKSVLCGGFTRLPKSLREYVRFIERESGVPVSLLGLGRRRRELLDLRRKRW
ncbi:MAG: adenylosuccinate synthase [Methanobacteriota archaeon]|nr:MAG: adenylosuccinate synthase [Euryarchaeota archaeon]